MKTTVIVIGLILAYARAVAAQDKAATDRPDQQPAITERVAALERQGETVTSLLTEMAGQLKQLAQRVTAQGGDLDKLRKAYIDAFTRGKDQAQQACKATGGKSFSVSIDPTTSKPVPACHY